MSKAPHDTVATALLDAVATGPVLDTGGVDRATVECAEALYSINDNLARGRYREEHPDGQAHDLSAAEEGRQLWATDGVAWLLAQGHLRIVDGQGLALGKPYKVNGSVYVPGTQREEEMFRNIRRVIPKRLDLLKESVQRLPGLKEYFPVLLDTDDNVVDGRHRRALDPEWPSARVRVPSEVRVAAAVAANRSNAWVAADWERLKTHAQFVHGRKLAAHELARLALLDDHERSNRAIGGLVGCSEGTVRTERAMLEETAQITQFRATDGRPRKDGTPAKPRQPRKPPKTQDPELQRELRRRITAREPVETPDLAERFDMSRSTLHTAAIQAKAAHAEQAPKPAPEPPVFTSETPAENNNGAPKGPVEKKRSATKKPVSTGPEPLVLEYTEDARVLANASSAWMLDPNVLMEWSNYMASTAKRRGAS